MNGEGLTDALCESVLGIGVDIARLERFRRIAQEAPGGVAARLYTPAELAKCKRADGPQYLASRFAAKEAVMKSLGHGMGDVSFTDIEIGNLESGAPTVELSGAALRLARAGRVGRVLVSVSHDGDYVCAFAVALGRAD